MEEDNAAKWKLKLDALEKRLDEELLKSQQYEEEIEVLYGVIKTKDEEIEQLKAKINNQRIQKPTKKRRKINENNEIDSDSISNEDKINHPGIERLKRINEELEPHLTLRRFCLSVYSEGFGGGGGTTPPKISTTICAMMLKLGTIVYDVK